MKFELDLDRIEIPEPSLRWKGKEYKMRLSVAMTYGEAEKIRRDMKGLRQKGVDEDTEIDGEVERKLHASLKLILPDFPVEEYKNMSVFLITKILIQWNKWSTEVQKELQEDGYENPTELQPESSGYTAGQ